MRRYANGESGWSTDHLNRRFLRNLKTAYRRKSFTLKQAYKMYARKHRHFDAGMIWNNAVLAQTPERWPRAPMDGWGDMNCRNALCAAVAFGLLRRVGKGVYQFKEGK